MKSLFILLLAASLTANAWLLLGSFATRGGTSPAKTKAIAAVPVLPRSVTAAVAMTRLLMASDPSDLAALRDRLRASGADEASIRGVIEGALRARYQEQVSAWRIERLRTSWWRGNSSVPGAAAAPSRRRLLDDPLRELLGPDPLDLADAEVRYDFLSPEKRRLLAMIDLDYTELQARMPQGRTNAVLKSDLDQQELLTKERQKDLLAALTPEERAEYDLRFSFNAMLNSRRFAAMEVTEREFRTIEPMIDAMMQQQAALPRDANQLTARVAIEQRTIDQLVAAVGYDRALDYVWGVDGGPYKDTVSLLRGLNLPSGNAARLFELAAETGEQASAIHYDASLTVDQKRAALATLQQTVRPQLDGVIPPEAQSKLPEHAISWFGMLGDGAYKTFPIAISGNGYIVASRVSVMTPPKDPRRSVALPRPPGR